MTVVLTRERVFPVLHNHHLASVNRGKHKTYEENLSTWASLGHICPFFLPFLPMKQMRSPLATALLADLGTEFWLEIDLQ